MTDSSPRPGDNGTPETPEPKPSGGSATDRENTTARANATGDTKASPGDGQGVKGGAGLTEGLPTGDRDGSDDDEEDEEYEDEEDEDEDEEDEEDEEPKLKYARLTQHLGPVYRNGDATSAFLVAGDKMVRTPQDL